MKKAFVFTAVFLAVAFLACGCAEQEAPLPDTAVITDPLYDEEPEEQIVEERVVIKLGISMSEIKTVYQTGMLDGAVEQCGETNVDYVYASADGDAAKQAEQITAMTGQGCNAILAMPVSTETILASAEECSAKEILFAVCGRIPSDLQYIDVACAFNNKNEAYACGQAIKDAAAAAGYDSIRCIEIVGPLTDKTATERKEYFEEFAANNGIEIAYIVNAGEWNLATTAMGLSDAYDMLEGDFNAIYCPSDELFSACEAFLMQTERLSAAGEDGHVVIAGIGGTSGGLEYVRKGMADYICNVDPMELGRSAVACIYDSLVNGAEYDSAQYIENFGITAGTVSDPDLWGNIQTG